LAARQPKPFELTQAPLTAAPSALRAVRPHQPTVQLPFLAFHCLFLDCHPHFRYASVWAIVHLNLRIQLAHHSGLGSLFPGHGASLVVSELAAWNLAQNPLHFCSALGEVAPQIGAPKSFKINTHKKAAKY